MNKTLRWKIIWIHEVYNFSLGDFSTGCIFYVLKNTIEDKEFDFLNKICDIRNRR